jgi:hypothetical protein
VAKTSQVCKPARFWFGLTKGYAQIFENQDFLSFDVIKKVENQTFCYENYVGILFEIMINTKSSFFS